MIYTEARAQGECRYGWWGPAALRDFYGEYENDPGGYDNLLLELRAHVCGTRVGEVVAGSGGVATAISS